MLRHVNPRCRSSAHTSRQSLALLAVLAGDDHSANVVSHCARWRRRVIFSSVWVPERPRGCLAESAVVLDLQSRQDTPAASARLLRCQEVRYIFNLFSEKEVRKKGRVREERETETDRQTQTERQTMIGTDRYRRW